MTNCPERRASGSRSGGQNSRRDALILRRLQAGLERMSLFKLGVALFAVSLSQHQQGEVVMSLGQVRLELNRFFEPVDGGLQASRSCQNISKVVKEHPERADILQRLGLACYLSNRFADAIPPLERALKLNPSLWGAALFLGISDYRTGRFDSALASLQNALRTKPDLSEARFWLGSALLALGKNEDAALQLETVPTGSPERTEADYLLAQAYRKAAESFYAQIERLDADSYRAHQLEAESLAWRGEHQKAILEYRKALQRKPDVEGA